MGHQDVRSALWFQCSPTCWLGFVGMAEARGCAQPCIKLGVHACRRSLAHGLEAGTNKRLRSTSTATAATSFQGRLLQYFDLRCALRRLGCTTCKLGLIRVATSRRAEEQCLLVGSSTLGGPLADAVENREEQAHTRYLDHQDDPQTFRGLGQAASR